MNFFSYLDAENINEVISFIERKRRSMAMKRIAKKAQRAKKRKESRPATDEEIMQRARKYVTGMLKAKFAGGKDDLSRSDLERVEKRLEGMGDLITRLARKQFKRIKAEDKERKAAKRAQGAIDGIV